VNAITAVTLALALAKGGGAPSPVRATNGPRASSSSVPTAAFASDGTLWVAWVDGSHVSVASSIDLGQTFSPAVRVSPDAESIDANGEARPKVAVGPRGDVYVSYTRKGVRPFTGDIRFARRLADGGFAAPITVNDDGLATGHRFDTLAVSSNGDVHLVWIDKRDTERAKQMGRPYDGAALYHAVSTDRGRTFSANRKVKDGICECCRLALSWDGQTPVLLWRDIMEGGVRDHAIARLDGAKEPAVRRATDDGWEINGCPHHGPALAVGADGTWHLAWFTGAGKRGAGTFYRRTMDGGRSFSEPMPLGSARAGRPAIAVAGRNVWLAWKEGGLDGEATAVRALRSRDAGFTWSPIREVARTNGASDHPLLVTRGAEVFLSWFTAGEGYRLVPMD
jgi:hypothetical protein